ncbi:MAG: T9SS type A sorting domain-containing protein [FCB group bacterium]|nr:T9SS type A sorting domain-containing protein [FCB group bacterium]
MGSLSLGEQVPILRDVGLPLRVVSGEASLLISWAVPDSIEPQVVHLYRSLSPDLGFKEIAVLSPSETRFNDTRLEPDTRYFYRVELDLGDGLVYTSSGTAPPFGRSITPMSAVRPDTTTIADFDQLFSRAFRQTVHQILPEADSLLIPEAQAVLWDRTHGPHPWLSRVSPDHLNPVHSLLTEWSSDSGIIALSDWLRKAEPAVRNQLLLLPEEWATESSTRIQALENRLEELSSMWDSDLDFLASLPNVVPVQIRTDTGRVLILKVIHPEKLLNPAVWVASEGDTLFPNWPDSLYSGLTLPVALPTAWHQGVLGQGSATIQTLFFDPEQDVINLFISGDVNFSPEWTTPGLPIAPEPQPVWINEWQYDPGSGKFRVELWNPETTTGEYGVFLNDQLVWDVDFGFISANTYQDSMVAVVDEPTKPMWLSLQKKDEDVWERIGSIPLFISGAKGKIRQPDGGAWTVDAPSLGRTNQSTGYSSETMNIPDVFALYQNYPNPFNSQTTISFDLLQSAKVSLYVMDARGRVVDTFAEESPMDRGTYTYSWNGLNHSSGIYFFTISAQVDDYLPVVFSRKMIYLK